jgi:hypothetical protein
VTSAEQSQDLGENPSEQFIGSIIVTIGSIIFTVFVTRKYVHDARSWEGYVPDSQS